MFGLCEWDSESGILNLCGFVPRQQSIDRENCDHCKQLYFSALANNIINLLSTGKSQYFAQPHPIVIAKYFCLGLLLTLTLCYEHVK